MKNFIEKALEENNIQLDNSANVSVLAGLAERLIQANSVMNLTAITDPEEIAAKHIADSLTCLSYLPQGARVLDIGSGAGFPALPIAVARPDLSVVALDSTAKKISYISETAASLGIRNIKTVVGRAEELAAASKCNGGAKTSSGERDFRERFDVVTARAVARLNVLCELSLPFLKLGGVFISMKSRLSGEELDEAGSAVAILGGEIVSHDRFSLFCKGEALDRSLIIIRKISHSSHKYPRQYSQILKKPL